MFFLVATIISVLVLCSTTDVRDKDNKTPLHWACDGGSIDVVQYLVEERKMDVGEIKERGIGNGRQKRLLLCRWCGLIQKLSVRKTSFYGC